MTSKIIVLVNGSSYVAAVSIATHHDGADSPSVETFDVRGGIENQTAREFYLGTNQTVTVVERYEPKELTREAAGLAEDPQPLSDNSLTGDGEEPFDHGSGEADDEETISPDDPSVHNG